MQKIYTSFQSRIVMLALFLLFATTGFSQDATVCGPVAQNFDNTGGSTAGFTGSFIYGSLGTNGYLIKANVQSGGVYTITSPTYTLPNNASKIGYGFELTGSESVSSARVFIQYVSTATNEVFTYAVGTIPINYTNQGSNGMAIVCRSIAVSELTNFPMGGKYRVSIELTANSGNGNSNKTLIFDNFRTNGTLSQIPLPVTFMGFGAKAKGSAVELSWQVAGEENVLRYEVEKSTDGRRFASIASVAASGLSNYTYADALSTGTVYYRIKNVDGDGKYKYSTIARVVNGRSEIVLKAFPQPVASQLTLQHPNAATNARISLSTADGRVLRTLVPASGSMQTTVDMNSLQPGLYLLRYSSGDGDVQTLKVVKQ